MEPERPAPPRSIGYADGRGSIGSRAGIPFRVCFLADGHDVAIHGLAKARLVGHQHDPDKAAKDAAVGGVPVEERDDPEIIQDDLWSVSVWVLISRLRTSANRLSRGRKERSVTIELLSCLPPLRSFRSASGG
jgi:hypothetical protein